MRSVSALGLVLPSVCAESISNDFSAESWGILKQNLREYLGESVYSDWIDGLYVLSITSDTVCIAAESQFARDWVEMHYVDTIKEFLLEQSPNHKYITISVCPAQHGAVNDTCKTAVSRKIPHDYTSKYSSRVDDGMRFDTFISDESNAFAMAAAKSMSCDGGSYNMMFLYGATGHGKTHLLQSIVNGTRVGNPDARVVYITAEKFTYNFVKALQERDIVAFKDTMRSADILIIDDIQFMKGNGSTQEELFHTITELLASKKKVIVAADCPISDLPALSHGLCSRISGGLVVDIKKTTYALRLNLLKARAAVLNISVDDDILDFIAQKVAKSARELDGALMRLATHASFSKRKINLDMAIAELSDVFFTNSKKVSISQIQKCVADRYGIYVKDILSQSRTRNIMQPRQIAMFVAKEMTDAPLCEIGKNFGGKDHATVIHSVRKIEQLCAKSTALRNEISDIKAFLLR